MQVRYPHRLFTTGELTALRVALGILVLVWLSASARADYQAGLDAYRSGNYEIALKNWLPLAKKGHAEAQNSVGFMYARGLGVPTDHKLAIEWYTGSAKRGFPLAAYNLGLIYARGTGTLPNQERATEWFRSAAEAGHLKAQIAYAERLRDGIGAAEDLAAAYAWLIVASDQVEGKEKGRTTSTLSRLASRMSGAEMSRAADLAKRLKARLGETSAKDAR